MTPPPPTAAQGLHKLACSLCARRKVKCDKGDPCSNCVKSQGQCSYETATPGRPRKRAADEELLARIAVYEDLMRKHNVDFSQHAHTWVSSGLEFKPKESTSQSPPVSAVPECNRPVPDSCSSKDTGPNVELCLWSTLSTELKHPPIQHLRHQHEKDDPVPEPTTPLQSDHRAVQPDLLDLHPEPKYIYRLWQIFVESVNPLMKVIHVPTLQQRVLDASWDLANAPSSLTATLFAIYTLSVSALSSAECQISFGETRPTLLRRYRTATVRALIATDFLTTRDFEVLQAFVLFLFIDPASELTCTLSAAAMRLAQKMGMHRENSGPKISFFEKEMRIRVWWQLCGIDSRCRAKSVPGTKLPLPDLNDVRPPLNISDADLHPDMVDPPVEHDGPSEMIFVLLKLEVSSWLRSSPMAAKAFASIFENIVHGPGRGKNSTQTEDEAIDELEAIYETKFIRHCDKRIPLHALTRCIARFAVSRIRFNVHHPRGVPGGGDVYLTREESDLLFESAVTSLEMVEFGINIKYSAHICSQMTSRLQIDAFIYVLSDLRRRGSGNKVADAWRLVESLYKDHPELIEETESTFYRALCDLTLEAWVTRRRELLRDPDVRESDFTPAFIQLLQTHGQKESQESAQSPNIPDTQYLDSLRLKDDYSLDWDYWNEFLRV